MNIVESGRRSSGIGLVYPDDLSQWQQWRDSRRRLHRGKSMVTQAWNEGVRRVRRTPVQENEPRYVLATRAGDAAGPHVLVGIESDAESVRASWVSVLPYLSGTVSLLFPAPLHFPELAGDEWSHTALVNPEVEIAGVEPSAVVSFGQRHEVGRIAHAVAGACGVPEYVIQHDVLTPYAPPLPEGVNVLAWSQADAEFWTYRRPDVRTHAVGSQHLWESMQRPCEGEVVERPVFHGQLHDPALPRRVLAGNAWHFCQGNAGLYLPHRLETDTLSRGYHALWRQRGMEFVDPQAAAGQLPNQAVSMFSMDVLEAAARGIPAWTYAINEPQWLREFWDRYGMKRWGATEPTAAPSPMEAEPATVIARIVEGDA